MCQVSYAQEAIRSMMAKPVDRSAVIRKAVEDLGGKLTGVWMSFGEYDVVVILEMPNNVAAASLALAVAAGGSCKSVKTTPLLTVEEGATALKKAGKSSYRPIGAQK
jgi:uncharacterized protein with GYD domain